MKIIVFSFAILLFINGTNGRISYEHNERASNYCGLVNCEYLKTDDSDYSTYIPIENLTNIESYDGYILRFPFLVIGSRNAHVVLTNTESPDWDVDKGYEFVFGGWRNSRHAIRNRNGFKEFTYSRSENVISNEHPTRFLIEITESGYIRVFLNNNSEPFISTFDPNPLPVKYVSFRSHEDYDLEYFYNCPSLKDDLLPPSTDAPPVEDGDLSTTPLNVLTTVCKWYDAWKGEDSSYYKIEDSFIDSRSGINKTTLEFYIVYISTARIVLTTRETTRGDNYYEFIIDNSNNAKLVRRYGYYDSETLGSFRLPVYPSNSAPLKITIEISSSGLIEVYVGPGSYKSSLSVNVDSTLDINYVSFSTGGDTRTLYYFGCPIKNVTTGYYDILPAEDFSIYGSLDQNCSQFDTEEYIFSEYIPLSELSTNVQPDGYLIRLPFYIKANSDVHILFTSQLESKDRQFYQFVIDGSHNSYSSVSKNRDVLAKSNERNILDSYRAVRIVLEITNDGVIRIFTEYNKMKPLLEVHDPNPITNLKYLAFDGINRRNLFYYDCAKFKPVEVEPVTENITTEIAAIENATSEDATNETATFENATSEDATNETVTSENVTTEHATTEHSTPEHSTSENATTEKSPDVVSVVEQSFVSNGTDVQIDIRHNEILTSEDTTVIH